MTLEGKKLLIVDDQFGIRMLLDEVFKQENCQTFQAKNGEEALDIVQQEKPDLALLDMKIPGMDGLEILKQIKRVAPATKIVMMTAYGELEMVQEALKLGALGYFTKPFDIIELKQKVKQLL